MDRIGGGVVVSSWLSFLWLGFTMVMGYTYYDKSRNDPLWLKSLVTVLLGLCITDSIAIAKWAYDWQITYLVDPSMMIYTPVSNIILIAELGIVAFLVQLFYAWRLWMISSRRNRWLPTFICITSTVQMAANIRILVYMTNRPFEDFLRLLPTIYLWLGTSAMADIAITAGMLWYLRLRIRALGVRGMTFDQIVSRAVQANALSLSVQVTTMVMIQLKIGFYSLVAYVALVKVYTISVLSSLNARQTNDIRFEPNDSDLSYPLSFLRVKSRALCVHSGLNPNQVTAVSIDFRLDTEFDAVLSSTA